MKKISLLISIFVAVVSFAQTTRFVYEVQMKPDSNNPEGVFTESAYLDVTGNASIFYPENLWKRDSLISRMRATRNFDRSQFENFRSKIDYIIDKDYSTGAVYYKQRIARETYQYPEDREMVWKISSETTKIGDYKVQKAETDFAGRQWTAWFSSDFPFQDGPYKFKGLPGMIIQLEDQKGDYVFSLKETKKVAEPAVFNTRGNLIKVKRKVFEKQMENFKKDPISFIQASRQSTAPPPPSGSGRRGGGFTADPQQMKQFQERLKKEIAENNNPIELQD